MKLYETDVTDLLFWHQICGIEITVVVKIITVHLAHSNYLQLSP